MATTRTASPRDFVSVEGTGLTVWTCDGHATLIDGVLSEYTQAAADSIRLALGTWPGFAPAAIVDTEDRVYHANGYTIKHNPDYSHWYIAEPGDVACYLAGTGTDSEHGYPTSEAAITAANALPAPIAPTPALRTAVEVAIQALHGNNMGVGRAYTEGLITNEQRKDAIDRNNAAVTALLAIVPDRT